MKYISQEFSGLRKADTGRRRWAREVYLLSIDLGDSGLLEEAVVK
jgi:hypothetical protein